MHGQASGRRSRHQAGIEAPVTVDDYLVAKPYQGITEAAVEVVMVARHCVQAGIQEGDLHRCPACL